MSTTALWATLMQPESLSRMREMARGTSGSHQRVAPSDAMAMMVPDARTLSDGLHATMTALGIRRWQAGQESVQLADLRDTLLPHLMSGRISVRDAEAVVSDAV